MKILLVTGGKSYEEKISVLTGIKVYHSLLASTSFQPILIYYDPNASKFYGGKNIDKLECYDNKEDFKEVKFLPDNHIKIGFKKYSFDLIFPLVHGSNAEDGTMASFFQILNYPVLSLPIQAASIIQDKILFKDILNILNINTPKANFITFENYQKNAFNISKYLKDLTFPLIIKPYNLGSSIGINIADNINKLYQAIDEGFKYADKIIIEEYIQDAEEYNIALLKDTNKIIFSAVEKIIKHPNQIYTYEDKYLNTSLKKEVPAKINEDTLKTIQNYAEKVYSYLGLYGPVRFDFLVKDQVYLNEANSIPGNLSENLFNHIKLTLVDVIKIYIETSSNLIKSRLILKEKEKTSFEVLKQTRKYK